MPARSNFVTAVGDVCIYKKSYSLGVWGVLSLMMASAIVGASTDTKFTWTGYSWQAANCLFTSAYALYLRSVMDQVGRMRDRMVWRLEGPPQVHRTAQRSCISQSYGSCQIVDPRAHLVWSAA